MRRLLASIRWNIVLQFRNGFYAASVFFILVWVVLLYQLPAREAALGVLLPPILFMNLLMIGFYFVAGLLLLEKAEGTLSALVVTPLRDSEYLSAKLISLSFLGVLECLIIVLFAYGTGFRPIPLLIGLVLACAFYVLIGLVVIVRYESINEFLIPSMLYVTFLILPVAGMFEAVDERLLYVHPLQPSLMMLRSAFETMPPHQTAFALVAGCFWTAVSFAWARRVFRRFIFAMADA